MEGCFCNDQYFSDTEISQLVYSAKQLISINMRETLDVNRFKEMPNLYRNLF